MEAVEAFAARHIAEGRAVQVAAFGRLRRVKIAVRIEPEHEKRAPRDFRMAHGAQNRAERQGMISAHEDRQAVFQSRFGRLGEHERRQRGQRARAQDDRVARHQRRDQLLERHHDRRVVGRDG